MTTISPPSGDVVDATLARDIADRAGRHLMALRRSGATGADLRAEGDRAAHELIVTALNAARAEDAVLSEEGKDDPRRGSASRVWIVDPLDGTREFAELDRSDWAVHVALWEGELVAGAVALPALGEVLGTDRPPSLAKTGDGVVRIAVSRTRPPALIHGIVEVLEASGTTVELVPMGSAGRKVCAVIRGEADAYVHAGGQYEWDSAAPVAVARASGLHTSRLDGSPLLYNASDPYLPDLIVAHPDVAPRLLEAIRTCTEEKIA